MTGTPTTADCGGPTVCRRDRVYATTELRFARVYAALAPFGGCGDVYEVELDAPIKPDGDEADTSHDSVCAPSATVVQVIECHVDLDVAREELAAQILALVGRNARERRPLSPLSGLVGRPARDFGQQGAQLI
jgi:hypothetical protein